MLRRVADLFRVFLLLAGTALFTFATINWTVVAFVDGPCASDAVGRMNRMVAASVIFIPLWLLSAPCPARPVTSFLVRRRRRGRGFEVETQAAGDSAADPPD